MGDKKRNLSIDVLRGIGIITVIVGHLCYMYDQKDLFKYIYSFHMPLFFFISGFLRYGKEIKSIKCQIVKGIKKLIIPYYIFLTISILFTNIVISYLQNGNIFSYDFNWDNALRAYGFNIGYIDKIPSNNFALWYLPLFFVASLIFDFILKHKKLEKNIIAILIGLIIITLPFQIILPGRPFLHINVLPIGLAFMIIGYLVKKYSDRLEKSKYILPVVGLILGLVISSINGGNISNIGNYIYYVGAIGTIYFLYTITKNSNNHILAYIGKNSLLIYAIHSLVYKTYEYTYFYKFFTEKMGKGFVTMMSDVIYTLIICVIICYTIQHGKKFIKDKINSKQKIVE